MKEINQYNAVLEIIDIVYADRRNQLKIKTNLAKTPAPAAAPIKYLILRNKRIISMDYVTLICILKIAIRKKNFAARQQNNFLFDRPPPYPGLSAEFFFLNYFA